MGIVKMIIMPSFLLFSVKVHAGVEQEMKEFLFSNSETNYTDSDSYKSQTRGYYATPSVYTRNPIVSINPVSIALPKFRAGCGGIDMFAGSFSHINEEQFVALLKAIPSNALGYAFSLALETISPSIKDVMDKMEEIVRQINSTNLNSCELGKAIVNSSLSKFEKGAEIVCVRKLMESGRANDIADAKKKCTSGGEKSSAMDESDDNDDKKRDDAIVDINYAWNAMTMLGVTVEIKEFIQGLTGTIIVQKSDDDNSSPQVKIYPSIANDKETIDALLYGGTMKRYMCDDSVKCLNPSDSASMTITSSNSFYRKVNNLLLSISNKMLVRDKELNQEESDLLSTSSLPIVAIIRSYQSYYKNGVDSMVLESLSEIISYEILSDFLRDMLETVKKASKQNIIQMDETKINQFEEGIKKTRSALRRSEVRFNERRDKFLKEVQKAKAIEVETRSRLLQEVWS